MNLQIRSPQVRVIGPEGENYGLLTPKEGFEKAQEHGMDLIEISPNAKPPVAKILDYGRFRYEEKKKKNAAHKKTKTVEVKSVQFKLNTSENDLSIKAARASEWLEEGHRIKIEFFLVGRSKYMDPKFLDARFDRILSLLKVPYKIAEGPEKGPKGRYMIIERGK